ncbi:fluoride efflux transporter FluC [Limnochorda pilosa]|uniref:Fluoride-specific ion channel FluC n=1 Tax=Limnochorda pilosa TaxID=1555112 RepID=A0A0K2SN12_LIMPI|nr:CrcB family protein [Limnochorda pilosa]BAS28505.1 camphor resistance protein CrcB [Limnochorda pilosa]
MWKRVGAVGLGGALGGILRQASATALSAPGSVLPWGTLLVNAVGSLALGALMGAVLEAGWPRPGWREFWTVGLLGSLTTYSTLAVETLRVGASSPILGGLNLGGNLLLGLAAAWIGLSGGRNLALRVRHARGVPRPEELRTGARSAREVAE